MKKLLFIALAAMLLSACGGAAVSNNAVVVNANSANTAANTNANTAANAANANSNANANAAKPATSGPTRIVFVKGETAADQSVTLAAGTSKQFVVGAKNGQVLVVEPNSDKISPSDLKVTMITKGKTAENDISEFMSVVLTASGDFVFEVKNTSKKSITVPLHIQIDDGPQ